MNEKDEIVRESLDGLCLATPQIQRIKDTNIIVKRNIHSQTVQIICGGGAGHEPAHAGFVCDGMLSAAVCGGVYASPSADEVLQGIRHVATPKGVLVIIMQYTGDTINFGLAVNVARSEGILVESLIMDDDCALSIRNKRGIAGTILLYKILAGIIQCNQEISLKELVQLGIKVKQQIFTLGVSMYQGSLPGQCVSKETKIKDDEYEIGLGIHGEMGKCREQMTSCDSIMRRVWNEMNEHINAKAKMHEKGQCHQQEEQELVVLVNNLGSTTELEMGVITNSLIKIIEQSKKTFKIQIERLIVGRFMTSLEAHGVSISILQMSALNQHYNQYNNTINNDEALNQMIYQALDLPVQTRYWSQSIKPQDLANIQCESKQNFQKSEIEILQQQQQIQISINSKKPNDLDKELQTKLEVLFKELLVKEEWLNQMDQLVGDGDLGEGMARAGKFLMQNIKEYNLASNLKTSLQRMGKHIAWSWGGTSGPLYGVFLITGAALLKDELNENTAQDWLNAMQAGTQEIMVLGRSQPGDRTMVDALFESIQSGAKLMNNSDKKVLLQAFVEGAKIGVERAAVMRAKVGRAVYSEGKEVGHPEPGCLLVQLWLQTILRIFFQ